MTIVLSEIRIKRDQMTQSIVSGLKDRSRLHLNRGVFTEEFHGERTWFEYRLLGEQNLDANFGRFRYPDQHPLGFARGELADPLVETELPFSDVKPFDVSPDVGGEIVDMYQSILARLCRVGEIRSEYGETAKRDVTNVQLYNERITGIGTYVAEAKIQEEPEILTLDSDQGIRARLIAPQVERQVIESAMSSADNYGLRDLGIVEDLFKSLIRLTLSVEVMYVKHRKGDRADKDKLRSGAG